MSKSSTPPKTTYDVCGYRSNTVALSFLIVTTALILGAIVYYGSKMGDEQARTENRDLQLQIRELRQSVDRMESDEMKQMDDTEPMMENI